MKYLVYLFSTLLLLGFFSCEDDEAVATEVTDVELTLKANYDGETFMTEKDYDYDGTAIRFTKLAFYISDIVLLSSGSGEIELKDVEFVDLGFNISEQAQAEAGVKIEAKQVDVGSYSGIRFGLGVPADLNRTSWTDYGSGHPLRNDSHYWSSWESFIFAKIEGKIDTDGDGMVDNSFLFHTGSDDAYTERSIGSSIDLVLDELKQLTFNIDVKDILKTTDVGCDADGNGYLDLQTTNCNRTHSLEQIDLVKEIMSNFSLSIEMN